MKLEEIFEYIITNFEGDRFQKIMLKQEIKKDIEEEKNRVQIQEILEKNEQNKLLEKLAKNFMEQYLMGATDKKFSKQECKNILELYENLIEDIMNEELDTLEITKNHFNRMRELIVTLGNLHESHECNCGHHHKEKVQNGYTHQFALKILGIQEKDVKGTVLEIGCTKNAPNVKYLRNKGIQAFGLDIAAQENEYLEQEDWLQKDFGTEKYDLIFSNLGFTKHFLQNHFADEGDYAEYAISYMRILNALKVGGKFHYVPAVTFIEELLPEDRFEVINELIDDENMRTIVTRLQ